MCVCILSVVCNACWLIHLCIVAASCKRKLLFPFSSRIIYTIHLNCECFLPQIMYAVAIADVCGFVWQTIWFIYSENERNYVKLYNKVWFGRFTNSAELRKMNSNLGVWRWYVNSQMNLNHFSLGDRYRHTFEAYGVKTLFILPYELLVADESWKNTLFLLLSERVYVQWVWTIAIIIYYELIAIVWRPNLYAI